MSICDIADECDKIEDKSCARVGIEEITRSSVFDFEWFQGIFETPRMNFAEERGSEGCPVNRRFKTGEVDNKSLQSDKHPFQRVTVCSPC